MKEWEDEERRVGVDERREKHARWQKAEGKCECCRREGAVWLTDDGDFCEACLAKMAWLR